MNNFKFISGMLLFIGRFFMGVRVGKRFFCNMDCLVKFGKLRINVNNY